MSLARDLAERLWARKGARASKASAYCPCFARAVARDVGESNETMTTSERGNRATKEHLLAPQDRHEELRHGSKLAGYEWIKDRFQHGNPPYQTGIPEPPTQRGCLGYAGQKLSRFYTGE